MAVPKKKTSKSKQGMRRAHDFIKASGVVYCAECGAPVMPHNVCRQCGFYNGRNTKIANLASESAE